MKGLVDMGHYEFNNLLKVITHQQRGTAAIWICDLQIQKLTRLPLSHRASSRLIASPRPPDVASPFAKS